MENHHFPMEKITQSSRSSGCWGALCQRSGDLADLADLAMPKNTSKRPIKNMPGMDRNIALFARHHIIFLEHIYIYICKNTYTHILHILCNLYNLYNCSGVWTACGRHWMVWIHSAVTMVCFKDGPIRCLKIRISKTFQDDEAQLNIVYRKHIHIIYTVIISNIYIYTYIYIM